MKKLVFSVLICLNVLYSPLWAQIPSDGLVAWYPFNGNANDESGNGNHGVVNGATLTGDRDNVSNKAFHFNGISNSIITSNQLCQFLSSGEISISIWTKSEEIKSQSLFEEIPNNPNYRINAHLNYNELGRIFWDYGNISAGGRITSVVSSCSLNQWEHYVFVASSINSLMTVYRNGLLEMQGEYFSNYFSLGDLSFGGNPTFFQGDLDDISILIVRYPHQKSNNSTKTKRAKSNNL